MVSRLFLYYHTVIHLKPVQVFYRVLNGLGLGCSLGAAGPLEPDGVEAVACPVEMDFDPVFLARFPVEELMADKITILHSRRDCDWRSKWEYRDEPALWNYHLHYFEYLFPLIKAYRESGDGRYLNKTVEILTGWIDGNAAGTRPAWAPYPTALRIVNWIGYYGYVGDQLPEAFRRRFLASLHAQYGYLAGHLEKAVLGNHYFEDLKSLVLASLFFRDEKMLARALAAFQAECREEILPDGMHFERSPMYHKLVFEGMLRTAAALRKAGRADAETEAYLQPMLDAAYSLEAGIDRLPLFHDGGNNVAKSIDALTDASRNHFGLRPRLRSALPDGGFYIFTKEVSGHRWKLIVDAGPPGPVYIPGHAHCCAMSFELFCDGKPVIVNCGTYAYQCAERRFFRSTAAHNTVMANGVEQSQCWGVFRLAKRSSTRAVAVYEDGILMELVDQRGRRVQRRISLGDCLLIEDTAPGCRLTACLHPADPADGHFAFDPGVRVRRSRHPYAVDYGLLEEVGAIEISGADCLRVKYDLER